ncbi:F0F1 ATP synthase subunit epsilon [Flavobacterium sp. WC2430]|uniref:F0F1 ATP synthase subunit epsilon n=1 Tax=Flavobacterium sp. WC2430 TaxID=3234137 RepID=UPI003464F9E8
MESTSMNLKILLPYKIFNEIDKVEQIIAETTEGSFGFLPHRLDCVAALVPGILAYKTAKSNIQYVAIDQGILIKFGSQVFVSVRNAVGGKDLGKLQESIENEFKNLDDKEKQMRSVMTKLESSFIQTLKKFRKE